MKQNREDIILKCSFCGRPSTQVKKIYKGVSGTICIDCANVVVEDLSFDYEEIVKEVDSLKKPFEIVEELDKYIIGQDEAKKILSVAAYNHYKRISFNKTSNITKANILLVGPTGSGKTYMMEQLGKVLDVPVAVSDATTLTETGYVGEDVESVLTNLLKAADMDIEKAERGIVYIDEIDKLAARSMDGRKNSRDVSGEGVQQGLLKLMEGTNVDVPVGGKKGEKVKINTKNILFVCSGAFSGLEEISKKRVENKATIGFGANSTSKQTESEKVAVIVEDLVKYGMIPEFLGRLPVIVQLDKLNKDDLKRVFMEPEGALLSQYLEMFKLDGIELEFLDTAIDYIAEKAYQMNIGARGIRSVIEPYMYDLTYKLTKEGKKGKYEIDKEMIEKHA